MSEKSLFSSIALLAPALFLFAGCQIPPETGSYTRPELKIIDYVDVPRRDLILPKSQFYQNDTVAVCVHGFAGRTVTVQLWEQKRGLLKTWSQWIHPAHRAPYSVGAGYVETDWVLQLDQLPPGSYDVRLTSSDGVQQQASFSVSR